ncbi:hypothetical protein O9929_16065 [Vibrio lentus]|nr:hypothetical protein [Vibrio lentus]
MHNNWLQKVHLAELDKAQFDLNKTLVVAPLNGYVTQVALRPGAKKAVSFPFQGNLTFVRTDESKTIVAAFKAKTKRVISNSYEAEVTLQNDSRPRLPSKSRVLDIFKQRCRHTFRVILNDASSESRWSRIN